LRKYFYTDGASKFGPFSKEELSDYIFSRKNKIWYFGLEEWKDISEIPELNSLYLKLPPEIPNQKKYKQYALKNLITFVKLQLFRPLKDIFKSRLANALMGLSILIICPILIWSLLRKDESQISISEIAATSFTTNENFDVYYEKFYRDLEYYGIYPKKPKVKIIKFAKLDQLQNTTHLYALSLGLNDDDRIEIYVNPSTWGHLSRSMKYYVMYHELSHDVLNLNDLEKTFINQNKIMYPEVTTHGVDNMDDFIERFHSLFYEVSQNSQMTPNAN